MSILRRKWNFKYGMLAVACLGFSYQGCSSRYKREREFQDKLFYTNNPYKFAGYCRQEFEALLTFKTADDLDRFVKNIPVKLQAWEESDHYKALFRRVGKGTPIEIWEQYRQDYLVALEESLGEGSNDRTREILVVYHNAMGKIFQNPRDESSQKDLIACHKSLSDENIRKKISAFYLQNYSGRTMGDQKLQQSLLDFYLLMDFVCGGDRALEWCGAIKQVEKSSKEWSQGDRTYEARWGHVYNNHRYVLEHDPVWRYEENICAVVEFITLSDKLIRDSKKEGFFNLTFEEVQSVIPYGVLLLSEHLDYLDQGDEDVKRLRELCDLFRPIVMA